MNLKHRFQAHLNWFSNRNGEDSIGTRRGGSQGLIGSGNGWKLKTAVAEPLKDRGPWNPPQKRQDSNERQKGTDEKMTKENG